MNKKTYINPELEVVQIKPHNALLIVSDTSKGGEYGSGEPVDAPGFVEIDEMDIFKNL